MLTCVFAVEQVVNALRFSDNILVPFLLQLGNPSVVSVNVACSIQQYDHRETNFLLITRAQCWSIQIISSSQKRLCNPALSVVINASIWRNRLLVKSPWAAQQNLSAWNLQKDRFIIIAWQDLLDAVAEHFLLLSSFQAQPVTHLGPLRPANQGLSKPFLLGPLTTVSDYLLVRRETVNICTSVVLYTRPRRKACTGCQREDIGASLQGSIS